MPRIFQALPLSLQSVRTSPMERGGNAVVVVVADLRVKGSALRCAAEPVETVSWVRSSSKSHLFSQIFARTIVYLKVVLSSWAVEEMEINVVLRC